ncbi:MAG: ROK family protein [Bacilli bacterium]|nr:ROK family protein [Bacilli bacterium]
MKSIGIDIGASHIAGGIYDFDKKLLINKKYIINKSNNVSNSLIEIVEKIIDIIILNSGEDIGNISSIGIACPGGVDVSKKIFYGSETLNVGKINFKKELQKYNRNIYIENDCTCAGICESYIRKLDNFIIFTLGSDVGMSYIKDFQSNNQIISELKRINNKEENTERYIKSFADLCNKYNNIKETQYTRGDFFKLIKNKDKFAKDILKEFVEDFAKGIRKIKNNYGIYKFCIGGGLSNYYRFYIDEVRIKTPECSVYIAKYKNDSGIIGAALLEKWQTKFL